MKSFHNSCPFYDVKFILLIDASSQKRSYGLSLAAVAIAYRGFALPELSDAGIGVCWLGGSSAARHPGQDVRISRSKNIDMLDNFQLIFSARINDPPVQTRVIDALKSPNDRRTFVSPLQQADLLESAQYH